MSEKPSDTLLGWAAVGSRISGFHHDSASKLQSLMMAIDEATELASDPAEQRRALDTAMTAVKDLHGLLTENRALAKAPVLKDCRLAPLLDRAIHRHGLKLRGTIPDISVRVAPPSFVHAIALLVDSIGGPATGTRVIDVVVTPGSPRITLAFTGVAPAESAHDSITIASWMLEREDCEVYSAPSGYQIHVPMVVRSTP